MTKPDGGRLDVVLLRPVAWLEEAASVEPEPRPSGSGCDTLTDETPGTGETPVLDGVPPECHWLCQCWAAGGPGSRTGVPKAQEAERLVGATIYLDLAELGAEGPAEVVLVEPCPAIGPPPGEGCRIVTGTFAHAAGNVVDLTVEGLDEPIGTTANHPFWSEDRRAFIPAGELRPGETLRTAAGELRRVARVAARGTTEPVYNLEVDAEHVYYVTSDGVLVHNACGGKRGPKTDKNAPHNANGRVGPEPHRHQVR